jgi:Bacterial SH3 domain
VGAENIMTSIRSLVFGSFFLIFSLSAVSGQISESPKTYRAHRLRPRDEGQQDPRFQAFRQKLLKAISRKDAKFLLSIVDPNIQISFGGEEGIQAFRELWKPEDVNSEIWNTLAQLLRLGGTFGESKDEFWAPYVFSRFPDDYSGFDFSAIIAKDVRVRSEPNEKAPMIRSLSYDIVLNLSGGDSPEPRNKVDPVWVRIRLPDGREGFVSAQFIRSPTDYRAGFKRTGGKWLLTHLVAGD